MTGSHVSGSWRVADVVMGLLDVVMELLLCAITKRRALDFFLERGVSLFCNLSFECVILDKKGPRQLHPDIQTKVVHTKYIYWM